MKITVPQVFRVMGIVPSNEEAWSVGARIATMYAEIYGEQPPKDNRPKTSGGGTHCFALYPPDWELRIREVIHDVVGFNRAQGSLFDGDVDGE